MYLLISLLFLISPLLAQAPCPQSTQRVQADVSDALLIYACSASTQLVNDLEIPGKIVDAIIPILSQDGMVLSLWIAKANPKGGIAFTRVWQSVETTGLTFAHPETLTALPLETWIYSARGVENEPISMALLQAGYSRTLLDALNEGQTNLRAPYLVANDKAISSSSSIVHSQGIVWSTKAIEETLQGQSEAEQVRFVEQTLPAVSLANLPQVAIESLLHVHSTDALATIESWRVAGGDQKLLENALQSIIQHLSQEELIPFLHQLAHNSSGGLQLAIFQSLPQDTVALIAKNATSDPASAELLRIWTLANQAKNL